ncbi:MAG TPA: hypothetical protein PLM80_10095 [Mesotoga sp.]|jgi:tetrahydromethanopterin S-methyltransferase subunit G|nr:hypothetical protein [Mesotoga sp.]MDI9376298.1 hypothetical protein [Thermotogota bacterium]NLX34182.1 hypothetical protein [Thermotogaceae bacterium]MDD4041108.1 hypothetical protein [Mesotoga sp.]MDD4479424.1 hypothetical protein [Mesotoga sp.]
MRNRSLDLNYKSFTRNRLTMFEYRRKPLLDQLERIKNDIEKLKPQDASEKLQRPSWAKSTNVDKAPTLSKMSSFDERRYSDLQKRMEEVEEKLEALDIEEEDIELEAIEDEIKRFDTLQKEYLESLEKARKEFEIEWDLASIELKYSEKNYIHQLMSKLDSLRKRQNEINSGKTQRELKKKQETTGATMGTRAVNTLEDQTTGVRQVAQKPATTRETPKQPETGESQTIIRRRGGGQIKDD